MQTRLLKELCSIPTAPFAERLVIEYIRQFAADRPRLRLSTDRSGNLLLEMPGKARSPRWVFTAHMDHPGFVARRMIDHRILEADFRGYVLGQYFRGQQVRFFTDDAEIVGTVRSITVGKERPVPVRATLRMQGEVPAGAPGMWDQGTGRFKGKMFLSRVCDDLAGAAAALQMLELLLKRPPAATVAVLFTRAEEEGFVGAMAASLRPQLLRKSDRIIAIECSAMQPFAPQGKGAILRIGDRTSIFNSSLSYFIAQQAAELAKRDKTFHYQRALMPGGTCEATVYDVYGFTAASICVPLGNYHNMDSAAGKIAPEYIDVSDWISMVKLFVRTARNGNRYEPGHRVLKLRLEAKFRKLQPLLRQL